MPYLYVRLKYDVYLRQIKLRWYNRKPNYLKKDLQRKQNFLKCLHIRRVYKYYNFYLKPKIASQAIFLMNCH